MPNRSKSDIEKERNDINKAIHNFSEDHKALEPLAKAILLRNQNFSISAICAALDIHKSQFQRARAALDRGAPVGVRGRPQYLSTEEENGLKEWCIVENDAGRGPTLDALRMKVRSVFNILKTPFYIY